MKSDYIHYFFRQFFEPVRISWNSPKGKRIKEIRYPDTTVEKLQGGYEVNLVVVKYPVGMKR